MYIKQRNRSFFSIKTHILCKVVNQKKKKIPPHLLLEKLTFAMRAYLSNTDKYEETSMLTILTIHSD